MTLKPKLRQAQILDFVSKQGEVSVELLMGRFSVSAETIRRDLSCLAENGVLRKVHGGAKSLPFRLQGDVRQRLSASGYAKETIARKLANIIEPGSTLFLDTGSTTLTCAYQLADIENLTVITNSLSIAKLLGQSQCKPAVHLLGGQYAQENDETIGPLTIEQIGSFQVDYAVISAAAVDIEAGVTDASFDEAQIAVAMINCANQLIVVADSSKFSCKAAYRVCRLDRMDALVCERAPEPKLSSVLAHKGIVLY